jgi:catechol 2,3-dioxygenase-like lactoylglutathione lyase family enzyme
MKTVRSGVLSAQLLWLTLAIPAVILTLASGPRMARAAQASPSARPAIERPPIVGVAHIALKVDNLDAAREFYGHVLGLAEAFRFNENPDGVPIYFKVNDHQYVEIFPVKQLGPREDRLVNIAFETTDVRKLREYVASRGVEVPPPDDSLGPVSGFMVHDPDGHEVEFDQYSRLPGDFITRNFGKFLPATRISDHMIHVGVTVADRAAADRFYGEILGFKLMWYGGMKDDRTDWVDMRVPEGADWLEYMLNVHNPSPRTLGVMHHFALGVTSIQPAYQAVTSRGYKAEEPKIGRDGKWQLNLYDPDLTRAEVMELKPVEKPCCSPMILP